jgi:hypothetical protein
LRTEAPPVRLDPPLTPPAPTPAKLAQAPVPKPAVQTPPPTAPAPKAGVAPAVPPAPAISPPPAPRIAVAQAAPTPLPATPPPGSVSPQAASPTANAVARSGKAVLQIGAFESVALANGAWNTLKARHADVVADLSEDLQQVDLGAKGIMYRLRMGPFADRPAAVAACEKLKTQGVNCFVAAP